MKYGIIEGFYGKPWGFQKREAYISFMKRFAYDFYIYAPKADPYLREKWQQPFPEPLFEKLKGFGSLLRQNGIDWGVGFSPFEIHRDFGPQTLSAIRSKLDELKSLDISCLAILFDDMSGDQSDLAKIQIEVCHFIQDYMRLDKVMMCPSYYSFDPILEKVFGDMPENYLADLGHGLDKNIDMFWTGEKVCSSSYSVAHLKQVESLLMRKPFVWDNYPVNDGARMSQFLHLNGFDGRQACHEANVSGLAVNPMNEAYLSQLPLATLSDCLADPVSYQCEVSFKSNLHKIFGVELSEQIEKDLNFFESQGLNSLDSAEREKYVNQYELLKNNHNKKFVEEIIAYFNGEYLSDVKDEVPTQLLWQN